MACIDSGGNAIMLEIVNDENDYGSIGANWVDITAEAIAIATSGGEKPINQQNTFGAQKLLRGRAGVKNASLTIERSTTEHTDLGSATLAAFMQTVYGNNNCFWLRATYPSAFNADGTPNPQSGDERKSIKCSNLSWSHMFDADANGDGSLTRQYSLVVADEAADTTP